MKWALAKVRGVVAPGAVLASAIVAFLSIIGFLVVPIATEPLADMHITPLHGTVLVGETFTVSIKVTAKTPVNVFKGDLGFDQTKLSVESIDYNTSIADLWAKAPWYENGDGTIGFIGGTTMKGGFLGDGTLMTVTFKTVSAGDAPIHFHEARILEHDGLGTDAPLSESIDSIFTVEQSVLDTQTIAEPESSVANIMVVNEPPTTDLSGDGKQTLADISIFMLNMLGTDARFDFNLDGSVDTKDLSIIMSAK